MNREIKFRAWDGTKYITFDNHQYDLIYNDISGWNICPNLPNYKGEWTTGESSSSAKSFKLEQFTGLKDKNGVDIYEGDIIKWFLNNGKTEIEQVKHSLDWDGVLSPSNAPFMSAWGSTCGKYFKTFMNIYDPTRYASIIGNIHEHKHLLK